MKSNTVAIVQARVSSSRIPRKMLKKIGNKYLFELVIERTSKAEAVNHTILATSVDKTDDPLAQAALSAKYQVFRGSLDDVLSRYFDAAREFRADVIVRITGDCPFIDPNIIDQAVQYFQSGQYDYVSNALNPTYPDGLDVEVFSFESLERMWKEAKLPSEREHVTQYIVNHPEFFKIGELKYKSDLSYMRWTVDEEIDLVFARSLAEKLSSVESCNMQDILGVLQKHPEISEINALISRNEGLKKSKVKELISSPPEVNSGIQLQEKAKKIIPGMTQLLSKRPDQFSYGVWPGYFDKARGEKIWDLNGNEYADMSIGGIGANPLGYCDPDVDFAVRKAIEKGTSSSLNCPEEVELAEMMLDIHPWAGGIRYTRTGGEAMSVAVRIGRAASSGENIAFCGYHGWHDWYLSANLSADDALNGHLIEGLDPKGVPRGLLNSAFPFRYNDIGRLEEILETENIGLIVLETVRNAPPQKDFLKGVRRLADQYKCTLIFDEISSGFRITTGGAHLVYGVDPDIAVFSKAIGNGYPMAVIMGRESIMEHAQDCFISSTYWTERIGPTAAIAVVNKFKKENVADRLMEVGKTVQSGWKKAAEYANLKIKVDGIYPLSHYSLPDLDMSTAKAYIVQEMLSKGFLVSTSFYSMFAHKDETINRYIDCLAEVFRNLKYMTDQEIDIKAQLIGKPSCKGFSRLT